MPINYTNLLYGPVYRALGVDMEFILPPPGNEVYVILGLDKTAGVDVQTEGDIGVQTVRPAAVLRMADLASVDLAPDDLMDALVNISGGSWKVRSYYPKPSPSGQDDGELWVILVEAP